ncbi:MAG: ribonuclease HII [Pseudomonadota bacterium]
MCVVDEVFFRGSPSGRILAGLDEVGRGPLAGPVMAAAVVLLKPMPGLADSKTLSARRRESLADALHRSEDALIGLGAASIREIDELNILGATMLAMQRAMAHLPIRPDLALIDGNRTPTLPCPANAIVGGDRKVPAIAAASIVAKVTRDKMMAELDRRHPGYGWSKNAGYPTAEHRLALQHLGVSRHHRLSFGPVKAVLSG